ncbi:hypothetical protein AUC68_12755 [Methyloceanibacter methanicus]|uniref:Rhamnosyl O-methyltransferase n=1 Tax=Methyloceanibacter methanicus TaxID=1774968 RepID=A0A1E3W7Y8_9HYPH|nr:class I SAM-dependent methyltransferase [Methyloceanibacter methanicus]ODS01227.1 hypothetical protein AUC68_12755 [Methyloceanibacter methanicus]
MTATSGNQEASNGLNWLDANNFEIDGCRFTIDISASHERRPSTSDNFTLVKTRRFLATYDALASRLEGKAILELGIFQGGSLVYFDKRFRPKKLVGLDLRAEPIPALEAYVATRDGAVKTYYNTSQDDEAALTAICREEFGGEVDAVIDDASHAYDLTKKSFQILFPKLAPGGIYVIEDWAWSYQAAAQKPWRGQFWKTGLATLLLELVGDLASNHAIEKIAIDRTMAVITKSAAKDSQLTFRSGALRARRSPKV